jgi:uncharacterized membrane protein
VTCNDHDYQLQLLSTVGMLLLSLPMLLIIAPEHGVTPRLV